VHLAEHAALARGLGIPEVIVCQNGDLVELAPQPGIVDEIPAGRLYKDGMLILESSSRTVADRRRLSFGGIVSVSLAMNRKGELAADPEVDLIGVPEVTASGADMADIAFDAVVDTFESLPRKRRGDPESVIDAVRGAVRSAIGVHWGKKPLCRVQVLEV
jgi:ribonuclease J